MYIFHSALPPPRPKYELMVGWGKNMMIYKENGYIRGNRRKNGEKVDNFDSTWGKIYHF